MMKWPNMTSETNLKKIRLGSNAISEQQNENQQPTFYSSSAFSATTRNVIVRKTKTVNKIS